MQPFNAKTICAQCSRKTWKNLIKFHYDVNRYFFNNWTRFWGVRKSRFFVIIILTFQSTARRSFMSPETLQFTPFFALNLFLVIVILYARGFSFSHIHITITLFIYAIPVVLPSRVCCLRKNIDFLKVDCQINIFWDMRKRSFQGNEWNMFVKSKTYQTLSHGALCRKLSLLFNFMHFPFRLNFFCAVEESSIANWNDILHKLWEVLI